MHDELLGHWFKQQVESYTDLGEVFHENLRIRRADLPWDALCALLRAVEHVKIVDPNGICTVLARWSTGALRVYNACAAAMPDYMQGAAGASSRKAHLLLQRQPAQVSLSSILPLDPIAVQLLSLLTPHSLPPRRARLGAGRKHTVNVLTSTAQGLTAEPFDMAKPRCRFIRENYTSDVAQVFPEIVRFIQGKTPLDAGRLVLIDGPPGTGKTFLIQALLAYKSTCVLVPGAAGAMLDNPAFVPWVVNYCREANGITLVIEDADELLRNREQGGSLSALSGLLNATSGIMAALTNLRVLCTINTDGSTASIDPAVLRAGRLFKRVHIGGLPAEQARAVVLRETGNDLAAAKVPSKGLTLAECYALARESA